MANTISKQLLSASTDGLGVIVAATAATGNTIHTATSGSGDTDLVTLFAVNAASAARLLTVAWGSTATGNLIIISVPSQVGQVLVTADLPIRNSKVISAWASVTNDVTLFGYVNRIDAP